MREIELYPIVEKWIKRRFRCFKTAINKGLREGRIDVLGVRDIGGDLSGEIETIGIEVKRGTQPFTSACGQATGYRVLVNRAYLADLRDDPFTPNEVDIASNLQIGLIQIYRNKCSEILTSPYFHPITRLNMALLESIKLGKCRICGCFFDIGAETGSVYGRLSRWNVRRAIKDGKGIMFWNQEVADRKRKVGIRKSDYFDTFERRFICPDCVSHVLSEFKQPDK